MLDDLQWADEATLSLLSFLSRHAHRNRILTVAAFRDVHIPPPLAQLTGGVEVITLERLADEDSADLADAVAAGRLGSQSVSDVVRRAGGNPLFVRELTRLVATGRPPRDEPFQVPGGVREVVAQRLARLSPACRTMLDIAAVLGREVRLDIVARIVGEHEALPDLLTEAVGAKILMTPIDSRSPLVFAHDLFREVLSAMLSTAHKAQLHLTVARTMDELRAEGASLANSCVAAHFVTAASLGLRQAAADAVRHSQQAASEAAGQLAFEDAAGHLRRALAALDLADRPDPAVRLDLLLSLGSTLDRAGDANDARQVLGEAADLARQLSNTAGFARAAIGIHRLGALSGLSRDHTLRLLEEAGRGLAGHASPLRARVLASLARELHHTWDPGMDDRAHIVAAEAVDIARSSTTRPRLRSASSRSTTPAGRSAQRAHDSRSWPRCSISPGSSANPSSTRRPSCSRPRHCSSSAIRRHQQSWSATAAPLRTSATLAVGGERCPDEQSWPCWPASSTSPPAREHCR